MNIPDPETPQEQPAAQAFKLAPEYDTALIGATVSVHTADQFAYSLKTLVGLVMDYRKVQPPEARQIVLSEMIKPHGHLVTFINDEILLGEVEEKPTIIVPKKIGNRRWQ